jgi:microcystin-dependent protein
LLITEIPAHTHTVHCSNVIDNSGSGSAPSGNFWTRENDGDAPYGSAGGLAAMHPSAVAQNTGGQPHSNLQPYLAVNFCISVLGIFPSRN